MARNIHLRLADTLQREWVLLVYVRLHSAPRDESEEFCGVVPGFGGCVAVVAESNLRGRGKRWGGREEGGA